MPITIRSMKAEDKPALMDILEDTPEFKPNEVTVAEEVIDACLKDPENSGYLTLVALDGSELAGYICYGPSPMTEGTWDIYWEAVARRERGRGIGSALMQASEAEIVKIGGRLALIETSSTPAYEKTRGFHFKHGYETIAVIPDYYSPGDDKLILQKRLK